MELPLTIEHQAFITTPYAEALNVLELRLSDVARIDMAPAFNLSERNNLQLIVMFPGTRLHPPLAHSEQDTLITVLSGSSGLVWQNGWTYPLSPMDAAGWKAGTGLTWTIINEGGPNADNLILLMAQENKPALNKIYYQLSKDLISEEKLWLNPPRQNQLGPHPALPAQAVNGVFTDVPAAQIGPRPSNVSHGPSMTDTIREGELQCEGTSLSEETSLSGRIGINLEILPPGTRSSDAHAHKLEDELIYVLGGQGLVWINGHVTPVSTGDVVAFPAGTGVAHNFINDSNAGDGEGDEGSGEDLALWIFGENRKKEGERYFYPLRPKDVPQDPTRWWDWEDAPRMTFGPHSGRPSRPLNSSLV
ncbi:hypothetical protein FRB95_001688 [Tulasnella sp. JGI-2019a]|nr:hypothetical protein FRB95_001688 [Tulasnella sp. JGI-2019a]